MNKQFPSITALVPELKLGDKAAWNVLVEKFHEGLNAKARGLLRSSNLVRRLDPDDLVQDTIRKAWQQHTSFRGSTTGEFAAWLLMILRNTFVDKCRVKNHEMSGSWHAVSANSPTPSQIIMTDEREAMVHACIAELASEHRQVVVYRHLDGLKLREIAKLTNKETSTIAGIHRRALEHLEQLIKTRGDIPIDTK